MAFHDIELQSASRPFDQQPTVQLEVRADSLYAKAGKRLLDLVISVFLLPVLIPVMAVI